MIPNNRIEFAPLWAAGPRLRSADHAERWATYELSRHDR